jgi:type IV secretion system protein VirD4
MKKKVKAFDVFFFGTLIILAALTGAVVGYLLSLSVVDGEVDYMIFLEKFGAIDFDDVKIGLKSLSYSDNRYQLYGLGGGAGVAIIMMMYFSGSKKKYHHKGEEHGSARWATTAEKKALADIYDNDNNVIIASDLYLVKDRGLRERNKPSAKFKAKVLSLRPVVAGERLLKKIQEKFPKKEEDDDDFVDDKIVKTNFVTPPKDEIQTMLSLNTMVFGGTGTGKSRFFVKPNLMQCNCSYIITDPSGELLKSCGYMLRKNGYKIKVFNLSDLKHSNNYNPFAYVDYDDPDNMENDVRVIVETFMNCTKNKDGQSTVSSADPFWENVAKALLTAVCYLLAEEFPMEERTLSKVTEIVALDKNEDGKDGELSLFDGLFLERKRVAPDSLSVKYYTQYKQGGAKTRQSIIATLNDRTQDFNLSMMTHLTAVDNIGLETVGDVKTAMFIIIPVNDSKFNWVASMLYSQIFFSLYRRAETKYGDTLKLPVHVRFILDEFANTGKIPNFEEDLATVRKYEISMTMILQNLSQLKNMYEKTWSAILGNCDTTLFLGGADMETNEYIVKLLGKETIDTLSINKTKAKQGSTSYNDGILGRDIIMADELARLPNSECVVYMRTMFPIRSYKLDPKYHRRYKQLAMEKRSKPRMIFDVEKEVQTVRIIRVTETLAEATGEMLDSVNITFVDNENMGNRWAEEEIFYDEIFNGKEAVYTDIPPAA